MNNIYEVYLNKYKYIIKNKKNCVFYIKVSVNNFVIFNFFFFLTTIRENENDIHKICMRNMSSATGGYVKIEEFQYKLITGTLILFLLTKYCL